MYAPEHKYFRYNWIYACVCVLVLEPAFEKSL